MQFAYFCSPTLKSMAVDDPIAAKRNSTCQRCVLAISIMQVCCALSQIAKHSVDLAEVVVGAEIFPKILTCLKFPDEFVKKHAATVVREIAKHTPELAQLVVGNGGVGALVDYVSESSGNNRLPGIMALGYIAAFRYAC